MGSSGGQFPRRPARPCVWPATTVFGLLGPGLGSLVTAVFPDWRGALVPFAVPRPASPSCVFRIPWYKASVLSPPEMAPAGLRCGGHVSESRTGKRFPLELPIRIKQENKPAARKGLTANVSAAGVYIKGHGDFQIGSRVQFEITLPGGIIGTKDDVRIECHGRVVRLQKEGGAKAKGKARASESGMACVIDRYKFVRK